MSCFAASRVAMGSGRRYWGSGMTSSLGQLSRKDGFLGGAAAGGVGQNRISGPVQVVHEVGLAGLDSPVWVEGEAADGDGDDLGAGGVDGGAHLVHRAVLAG